MINKLEIELLASKIDVNETLRCVCPFCEGKQEKHPCSPPERSFMITKFPDKILYKCWRVKCGMKGVISNSISCESKSQRKKEYKYFTYPLIPIDDQTVGCIEMDYEITVPTEWKLTIEEDRIYMPCYSFNGTQIGCITKSLCGVGPKTISYWGKYEGPKYHFSSGYWLHEPFKLVIVEDIISATKVDQVCDKDCMALLGTNLNDGKVVEILRHGYKDVIIMLDPDATDVAFKYKEKYGSLFNSFTVIPMKADPKDTPKKELKRLLTNA